MVARLRIAEPGALRERRRRLAILSVQEIHVLTKFIPEGSIKVPLESPTRDGVTKEAVIQELVDLLPEAADPETRKKMLDAVLHREGQMSTGIGDGVAIPHGSAEIEQSLVISAGLAPAPGVEFASIDKQPARIFFLLVARQGERTQHLQALARIARLLKDPSMHERLLTAPDAEAFRGALREAE